MSLRAKRRQESAAREEKNNRIVLAWLCVNSIGVCYPRGSQTFFSFLFFFFALIKNSSTILYVCWSSVNMMWESRFGGEEEGSSSQGWRNESSEIRYRSVERARLGLYGKSWQYITVGGFSLQTICFSFLFFFSPDIFHRFPFRLRILSFIPLHPHTSTPLCAPFIRTTWMDENIFQSFFFIITLLNKTPSSDVWFQCCFFLSSVQFVLAHRGHFLIAIGRKSGRDQKLNNLIKCCGRNLFDSKGRQSQGGKLCLIN